MPMADSSPPMVVGIRRHQQRHQHHDAGFARPNRRQPAERDHGDEEDQGQPGEQHESASSLGVFWRSAPSTSAIMRSMKVCPAAR